LYESEKMLVEVFSSVQHIFIMTVLFVWNWPTDKEEGRVFY